MYVNFLLFKRFTVSRKTVEHISNLGISKFYAKELISEFFDFTFNSKGTLSLNGYATSIGWLYNAFGNMLTGSVDSRKSAAQCIAEEKKQANLIFANYN